MLMKSLSCVLLLICFVSFGASRDYHVDISADTRTAASYITKDSAISAYTGSVTYSGVGESEPCAWVFCITRSFRGIVTDHGDEDTDRILTELEGCLLVNENNVTAGAADGGQFSVSIDIDPFEWNAEGEFYLNGQLTDGDCAATLTVSGIECEDAGLYGFDCENVSSFPQPVGPVALTPNDEDLPSLVFAGLTSAHDDKNLGQLTMLLDIVDDDSDGLIDKGKSLGFVRLLLNGIPTDSDYDFEVPIVDKQTELSLVAARRDFDYFYSVQVNENVTVEVHVDVQDCVYGGDYGPNCSITADTLTTDEQGTTLTIDPLTSDFCYNETCYFYLVKKTSMVTILPTLMDQELAVLYKTNNFPTSTDFDVAMPGGTSFIPSFQDSSSLTQFAVYTKNAEPFTLLFGAAPFPPPPPPPGDDDDDDLPWAWIGVSIALGVIALALITGFVIYTCKPNQSYISIE